MKYNQMEAYVLKNQNGNIVWHVHCYECGEVFMPKPNGTFAKAEARLHANENPGHIVVVGLAYLKTS